MIYSSCVEVCVCAAEYALCEIYNTLTHILLDIELEENEQNHQRWFDSWQTYALTLCLSPSGCVLISLRISVKRLYQWIGTAESTPIWQCKISRSIEWAFDGGICQSNSDRWRITSLQIIACHTRWKENGAIDSLLGHFFLAWIVLSREATFKWAYEIQRPCLIHKTMVCQIESCYKAAVHILFLRAKVVSFWSQITNKWNWNDEIEWIEKYIATYTTKPELPKNANQSEVYNFENSVCWLFMI